MDYKIIQQLLDSYFEGETSLQEEEQLRRYFQQEDIHPSLKTYQPMFRYFVTNQEVTLADDFDAMLLSQIEGQAAPRIRQLKPTRRFLPMLSRIAATILLVGAAWWAYDYQYQQPKGIDWSKYEVTNAEEAFLITQTALKSTSARMKEGSDMAKTEVKHIKTMTNFLK
jgi:hypothetical protein